ncbi:MAG: hypothetical protein OXC01_03035 [Immundisolibacterales bacterium]|nr:hypothetical protein [Immundisolibacterales bacterium]
MGSSPLRRGDAGRPPLLPVLAAVPGAAMRALVARMPEPLWRALLGICGAVLLLAPLLLWVSWSRSGYLAILASAAAAMGIAYLLVRHAPEHRRL